MDFSKESQLKVAFNKVYLSVDVWMQRKVLYSNSNYYTVFTTCS